MSMYPITLEGNSVAEKRAEIKRYFNNSFDLFEKVFEVLRDESVFYKKSEPTRHPMIFYFGHTATFFVNKLINMKIIHERINPEFESIFAVGVDEMDWDDLEESRYKWPKVAEVREYRDRVRTLVNELIETLDFSLPIRDDSAVWIILMGIEHERIHIETSLVLHRQMPIEFVKEVEDFVLCPHAGEAVKNEMLLVKGGTIKLGKSKEHHLYGWDNEYGSYEEQIADFQAGKYLVSNGEFMEFVENGGYENEAYWDEEGKAFLRKSGARHPHFWVKTEAGYKYRALYKIIDMPMNWPVDVNALEAEAFCRYKSQKEGVVYQLPSEAEYAAIYQASGLYDIPQLHESRANINFYHYSSSCPVDEFGFNGIYDVIGNVWQWSRTPIRGFKGFEVHPAYDDFSTPTFDEKHALILGASWASSGNLIMQHSRYAFRKHFFQNAGFRYVISNNEEKSEDIYESDALVSQYCEFQYGDEHFGVKNFAVACAEIAASFANNRSKALDLGCATGRASFELAKYFDTVEGVDFSVRFVGVGSKLKNEGYVAYSSKEEGEITKPKKVTLQELGYEALKEKVAFWQGDACNLKPNFQGYDLIMATNIIEKLSNLEHFAEDISKRLNKQGVLVLASSVWQEEPTLKEMPTLQSLHALLADNFELLHHQEADSVIAQLSVWKKK